MGDARLEPLAVEQREEIFAAQRQIEEHHRLRRELGEAEPIARRQRMTFGQDGEGRQARQRAEHDVVAELQIVGQGEEKAPVAQPGIELFLVADRAGEGDRLVLCLEAAAQARHDRRRDSKKAADIERSRHRAAQRLGVQLQLVGLGDEAPRLAEQVAPGGGERQSLRVAADEELHAEHRLEMAERRRDRSLRDVDRLRRAGDAAVLAGGEEIAELLQRIAHGGQSITGASELRRAASR